MQRETDGGGDDGFEFSLVRGGPLYRLQRALRLIPADGLGVGRRILVFVALAWLPVAAGAVAIGRAFAGDAPEPLLQHFGVHVRCLVAIPLLIAAEAIAERVLPPLVRYFVTSGLVPAAEQGKFRAALRATERLRDSWVLALLVIGVAVAVTIYNLNQPRFEHEVAWAVASQPEIAAKIDAAGLWYLAVSRPLFLLLTLSWLARFAVLFALFRRIAALDLDLVAIHPDGAAGLGFLDQVPRIGAPVGFAYSAVLASQLGHEVLYHDTHVASLQPLMVAWLIVALVIVLVPLVPISARLARMRRTARLAYGDLLGRHGRLFAARWLARDRGDAELLGAPEISAATDALALYQAVEKLRPIPFGLRGIVPIVAAVALPLVPVFAIEVPIKELLLRIVKTLV